MNMLEWCFYFVDCLFTSRSTHKASPGPVSPQARPWSTAAPEEDIYQTGSSPCPRPSPPPRPPACWWPPAACIPEDDSGAASLSYLQYGCSSSSGINTQPRLTFRVCFRLADSLFLQVGTHIQAVRYKYTHLVV